MDENHRSSIPIFHSSNLGNKMRLGNLRLGNNLILAPMSGITDYPFRRLAKEEGCDLVFTGLVSAEGLLRKGKSFLKIGKDEHPISVQIFGSNPEVLAEAAGMAEAMGADVIDINMGCPAEQVVDTGAGVDLMRVPGKVKEMLVKVRKKVRCPLTIKIRSGWDGEHINAVEISKIAEDSGVHAISIHPRTKVQGFRGKADWNLIGKVKESVNIPVIGNGDVTTPLLAKRMLEEIGCDGVMIGRGALGNPWIFNIKLDFPSLEERQGVIDRHYSLLRDCYGDKGAFREIRRHVAWYTKGLPSSASFRSGLAWMREEEELFEAISFYFDFVERRDKCQSFESMISRSVT